MFAAASGYRVSSLASWNVKATTLHISPSVYKNDKTVKFVTKWEFNHAGRRAQLVTVSL